MTLPWAIGLFIATVGLADLHGYGHGFPGLCILAALAVCMGRWLPPRGWRWVFSLMLRLSVLVSILAIVQVGFMPRSRGIFASPNVLGAYAAIHLFFAFRRRSWLGTVAVFANFVSAALSQSRGAYLAVAAGIVALLWKSHRRLSLAICGAWAACAVIVTLAHQVDIGPMARLRFWQYGIETALSHPLLGWGQNGVWMTGAGDLYSVPLDWFMWTGILGIAAGGWMLWTAGRQADHGMLAVLVAWFVSGLFLFESAATAIPLWLALGYIDSVARDKDARPRSVYDGHPFLDGGMRADRAKRRHRGGHRAISREGAGAEKLGLSDRIEDQKV